MEKIILRKNKWYSIAWKDGLGKEYTHCAKVVANYGKGYLFWARRSPQDKKDEFCFGTYKENILKVKPFSVDKGKFTELTQEQVESIKDQVII